MKLSKVLSIIVLALMLVAVLANVAYAINPAEISVITTGSGTEKIKTIGGRIVGAVQVVGSVVAAVIIVVIGIKYMMGSAEEKAEYKKTMIPYIVGALLIFAGTTIAGMVYNMATQIK